MKVFFFTSINLLNFFLNFSLGFSQIIHWNRILSNVENHNQYYYGACAATNENEFSVIGSILDLNATKDPYTFLFKKTTDGGMTWYQNDLNLPKFELFWGPKFYLMSIPDSNHIFLAGDSGIFSSSSDAGVTWSPIHRLDSNNLMDISFGDSLHGIIVGVSGKIFITSDGGKTWSFTQTSAGNILSSCKAFSSGKYFIADLFLGEFFSSNDYGNSWDTIHVYKPYDSTYYAETGNLYFKDPSNGFLIGGYLKYSVGVYPLIARTTNGGKDWKVSVDSTLQSSLGLTSICFFNDKNGIAAGEGFIDLITTDGGNTWNKDTLNVQTNYTSISKIVKLSENKILAIFSAGVDGNIYVGEWGMNNISQNESKRIHKFCVLINPTIYSADFQFDELQSPEVFQIFDLLGRQILRRGISAGQTSLHIDMHEFPAGMYIARLGGESVKVIKN